MAAQSLKFSSGERTIAIIIGIAACLSVLSIVVLSARVIFAVIRPLVQGLKGRKDSREALFFRTPLGAYVGCLLLANFLAGIAGIFEFTWASQGGITVGPNCTAQGSLIQIGDFAGAYFTAVIAMHTFSSLVLHKRYSAWWVVFGVALGWGSAVALGTALTTISTSRYGPFFNQVGMWCAISSGYTVEQFVAYYLPIVISAFVTSALYAIIYLCLRGTLVIGDGIKLNLSPENVQGWAARLNGREEYRHFLGAIIRSLLWFPFAFVVLFLPITIAGLMRISGISNSDGLLALAGVTASLNGFANVLILVNTIRVLRPAINSMTASSASESFFVPEERKPSPIEAPKPMMFDEKSTTSSSPRSVMHGRAFPPPVSRVASPLSSRGSASPYGLPATPRSGRQPLPSRISEDGRNEHTPTPEMREMWLRHQRSSSSMDSTTTLLRAASPARYGHSRNASSSTSSENIHALIGKPILPNGEINRRVDLDMGLPNRSQTISPPPVITITRPASPDDSAGLPPPPRSSRGSTQSVPPVPPLPSNRGSMHSQHDSQSTSDHEEHEYADDRSRRPKTPTTARSMHSHSRRTSFSTEYGDFEIHRVDSRDRLKPAISAVARAPTPARENEPEMHPFPRKNEMGMSSVVSLPESVTGVSMHTGESEDTMHAEIRSRSDTLENTEGALSSIAWASLVAHAASQDRFASDTELRSPLQSDTWDDDREILDDEELTPPARPRRMSDVPMVLRPGTPDSVGADMYFKFDALSSSRQPQQKNAESTAEKNGSSDVNRSLRSVPGSSLRQNRSLNGVGTSVYPRETDNRLGRSNSRLNNNMREGVPRPGYI